MNQIKKTWVNLLIIASLLVVSIGFVSQVPALATETDDAYLQVVHLAPFAEDASVTITLNGADALVDFGYGDSSQYIALPAGDYDVAVIPTGAVDPAIEATVTLEAGIYYTAIAVGDGANQDLDLILLVDDLTEPAEGNFHLRLGHLAPFASGDDVLADVRLQDGTAILENVNFGAVTGYLPLPAGEYDLIITTPGGGTILIDPLPVDFAEGMIISAFASGEGVNQDLGVFALPAGVEGFFLPLDTEPEPQMYFYYLPIVFNDYQPMAYLQVVHLAPFAEDASVTVTLNGAEALVDFGYGDSTEYIALPAGDYDVAVIPTGAVDPAIEASVSLVANTYYTAIAVGDIANQDLDLILLVDDLTEPAEGTFHLRLGHLAPFASGDDVLADVRLQDGTAILENVDFGAVTGYLPLPAGEYDLIITTPGGGTILIDPLPVDFAEGSIISAFASGEGVNQDLGVFALPAGLEGFFLPLAVEPELAYLQVVHLAPFAEDASVTVTLNGAEALVDFGYGDSTEYIALPAGDYDVAVIPTGAVDPAIEATVSLVTNTYYTVIAVGDGVNQDLGLILLVDDLSEPAEGTFHLRLGHLAPFASGEAVLADVRLQDGTPILENVDFGAVTGYLPLPAGEYDLIITTPGGGTILIDPLPVDFAEGMIISAFASGEGVNQDLGVFALPAGLEGFFLPLATYLQVVHLAPFAEDASVTITLNGAEALVDFGYGDSTEYIALPAGDYDVAVIPTGAMDPAIEASVSLFTNTYYTAIAVGDVTNQDLDLILLVDDLTEPAEGTFHLRLGHLAPFASGDDVLADVRLQDGTPVLENVDFGDVSGYLPLPAGEYDLIITTPGGGTILIDPLPVDFAEGSIISAFASGEGVNQDLGVYALPAGLEGFFLPLATYLQVVHLAPFAADASATITLNGEPALVDFGYGDSTEYIALPAGDYDVAVIPTGAMDPAIEASVSLVTNTYYTTIAIGDGVNQDLDLILLVDDLTEPEAGNFHLRLGHLAPFASGDDVLADVRLQDGTPILENVDFGAVTGYLPLPAGEYDLIITTPGGGTILIDPLPVDFAEGSIISAFASGEGVNQDLGVFALPAGVQGFFLPLAENGIIGF